MPVFGRVIPFETKPFLYDSIAVYHRMIDSLMDEIRNTNSLVIVEDWDLTLTKKCYRKLCLRV